MTAQAPVNAIPTVCAARPGVLSHLDLPVFGGGYVLHSPDGRNFRRGSASG